MTIAKTDHALDFCSALHEQLMLQLSDPSVVRHKVQSLLPRNPFRESCFCKGCVLPVVDSFATQFLVQRFGADRTAIRRALRCEGFASPLYVCDQSQVGFSSHSRSSNDHPGDKSGRRASSRRSPDFCIRLDGRFRVLGELKYAPRSSATKLQQLLHEMRDYLSIKSEPDSDWGHDFAFGLLYDYGGDSEREVELNLDHWNAERMALSVFRS